MLYVSDLNVCSIPAIQSFWSQVDNLSRILEYLSSADRSRVWENGLLPSYFFLKLIRSLSIELVDTIYDCMDCYAAAGY